VFGVGCLLVVCVVCGVCCLMLAVGCLLLCVVCRALCFVRWCLSLCAVELLLFVVYGMLLDAAVWSLLYDVCCVVFGGCSVLYVVWRLLSVVC